MPPPEFYTTHLIEDVIKGLLEEQTEQVFQANLILF